VYEVVGTISERRETATTSRAGVEVSHRDCNKFGALAVHDECHASFQRPCSNSCAFVACDVQCPSELTENGPAPPSHPWSAPFAFPTHPEAGGEIRGKVTYEGTLPKSKPVSMVNEPTCAKHYTAPVFPENVVAGLTIV